MKSKENELNSFENEKEWIYDTQNEENRNES